MTVALAAPGGPAPLDGVDYPAPRFARYLLQERTDDIEELMPLARSHVRRRYGRSALGDVRPGDELLIVTFPHQNEVVFEALRDQKLRQLVTDGDLAHRQRPAV